MSAASEPGLLGNGRKPLRWQIRERQGTLYCVREDDAYQGDTPGESVIWSGEANHITEAYRKARAAGKAIYLSKAGEFRLRS